MSISVFVICFKREQFLVKWLQGKVCVTLLKYQSVCGNDQPTLVQVVYTSQCEERLARSHSRYPVHDTLKYFLSQNNFVEF